MSVETKVKAHSSVYQPGIRLHAEQTVIEVIAYMKNTGDDYLTVYNDNDALLGKICLADILAFLEYEPALYYHKQNYTLESFLIIYAR